MRPASRYGLVVDTDPTTRGLAYLEHLTARDLALLAAAAPGTDASDLRRRPQQVEDLLASEPVFEAVLAQPADPVDDVLRASPFLVFGVAVARAWRDMATVRYVQEWVGPRQRLPVFASDELRALLDRPGMRLFLTELLASYTHVASGALTVRTRHGLRRRRYNELDPVRLAGLLDVLPDETHVGVYRRLGDVALFLTGVFPDHTARRGLAPLDIERLARSVGPTGDPAQAAERLFTALAARGAVGLLEDLGARWYRQAVRTARSASAAVALLETAAEHFGDARRVLNHVTDHYLFPLRTRWFPSAS